jgi:hypothetical protein
MICTVKRRFIPTIRLIAHLEISCGVQFTLLFRAFVTYTVTSSLSRRRIVVMDEEVQYICEAGKITPQSCDLVNGTGFAEVPAIRIVSGYVRNPHKTDKRVASVCAVASNAGHYTSLDSA